MAPAPHSELFAPAFSLALAPDPLLAAPAATAGAGADAGAGGRGSAGAGPASGPGPELFLAVGLDSGITDFQRPRLNLVLLLDVSGSMDGGWAWGWGAGGVVEGAWAGWSCGLHARVAACPTLHGTLCCPLSPTLDHWQPHLTAITTAAPGRGLRRAEVQVLSRGAGPSPSWMRPKRCCARCWTGCSPRTLVRAGGRWAAG